MEDEKDKRESKSLDLPFWFNIIYFVDNICQN